jgi:hypothetical protein
MRFIPALALMLSSHTAWPACVAIETVTSLADLR